MTEQVVLFKGMAITEANADAIFRKARADGMREARELAFSHFQSYPTDTVLAFQLGWSSAVAGVDVSLRNRVEEIEKGEA